jgi:NitT/TauT family transport system permease protein
MKQQAIAISRGLVTPFDKINKQVFLMTLLIEWFLILTVWQINGGALIPKPLAILEKLFNVFQTEDFIQNLLTSLILTLKAIFFGTIISLVFAYGYKIGVLKPFVQFIIVLRYLPLTGIIFIFTLLTSNGGNLKLILLLFGIVPFFVTSMVSLIDDINPQLYDLCKTLRMNRWQTLRRVVIVGQFNYVFEVMRQNFAICWLMITMVEGLSMSEGGIGTMLIKQNKTLELEYVFAIQVTLFLLGLAFDAGLKALRNYLFKFVPLQKAK